VRYYSLTTAGTAYDFAGLRAAVSATIMARERSMTIDLDSLADLDADVMRELIRDVQKMHEVGGTLSLHVTRPEILDALKTAGLHKVFNLVTDVPPVD
jgi:anti-anti-sigma regulatory factor